MKQRSTNNTPTAGSGVTLALAMGILFVSALPDAAVVPVLRELIVDRYGVGPGPAHWFMSVNLLGAIIAAGMLGKVCRALGQRRTIMLAALANAALLGLMSLHIGFVPTLVVRFFEGFADVAVYAVAFDVIASACLPEKKGSRMGAAATFLMLGIAVGIGVGGRIGNVNPIASLWFGSLACLVTAAIASMLSREQKKVSTQKQSTQQEENQPQRLSSQPVYASCIMMFADRALGGLLATTLPLYLAMGLEMSPAKRGALVGVAMLLTALGACPMGHLADRIGLRASRLLCSLLYAGSLVSVPLWITDGGVLAFVIMGIIGLGGAGLFASSLLLVTRAGRGSGAIAAYHAAGNTGFLVGPMVAGLVLSLTRSNASDPAPFITILVVASLMHLIINAVAVVLVLGKTADVSEPVSNITRIAA